jgi:hypothetical protein
VHGPAGGSRRVERRSASTSGDSPGRSRGSRPSRRDRQAGDPAERAEGWLPRTRDGHADSPPSADRRSSGDAAYRRRGGLPPLCASRIPDKQPENPFRLLLRYPHDERTPRPTAGEPRHPGRSNDQGLLRGVAASPNRASLTEHTEHTEHTEPPHLSHPKPPATGNRSPPAACRETRSTDGPSVGMGSERLPYHAVHGHYARNGG